jgi:DNA-binding LacI/PurR family transcriptional regulator
MSEQALREAARLIIQGQAGLLLTSCAYSCWEKEWSYKNAVLDAMLTTFQVFPITHVLDSYEEARQAVDHAAEQGYGRIIVCSDTCHGPRAVRAFKREIARRRLQIEVAEQFFITLDFEPTFEPHPNKILAAVKSWRAGGRLRWRLWNWGFGLLDRIIT